VTCKPPAGSWYKAEPHSTLLSKLLLVILLGLLVSKLGFRRKLKQLLPRLDRAVNLTIIGLVVIYVGHAVWWLVQRPPVAP
jgi:hypothetical protein